MEKRAGIYGIFIGCLIGVVIIVLYSDMLGWDRQYQLEMSKQLNVPQRAIGRSIGMMIMTPLGLLGYFLGTLIGRVIKWHNVRSKNN